MGYVVFVISSLLAWKIVLSTDGKPLLTVNPSSVDVTSNSQVTITCSLDMLKTKTAVVYSVLIKRRGKTIAVCFKYGTPTIHDNNISIEKTRMTSTATVMQIKVSNVTCDDRGDYSCRMAVRRAYRSLQLVSNNLQLNVTGNPSYSVHFDDHARKLKSYSDKSLIQVGCSTLRKQQISGWSWTVGNDTSKEEDDETCVYSDEDCLYKCSSVLRKNISVDEQNLKLSCFVDGLGAHTVLNIKDLQEDLPGIFTTSLIQNENIEISQTTRSTKVAFICVPLVTIIAVSSVLICTCIRRHYKSIRRDPHGNALKYSSEMEKTLLDDDMSNSCSSKPSEFVVI